MNAASVELERHISRANPSLPAPTPTSASRLAHRPNAAAHHAVSAMTTKTSVTFAPAAAHPSAPATRVAAVTT